MTDAPVTPPELAETPSEQLRRETEERIARGERFGDVNSLNEPAAVDDTSTPRSSAGVVHSRNPKNRAQRRQAERAAKRATKHLPPFELTAEQQAAIDAGADPSSIELNEDQLAVLAQHAQADAAARGTALPIEPVRLPSMQRSMQVGIPPLVAPEHAVQPEPQPWSWQVQRVTPSNGSAAFLVIDIYGVETSRRIYATPEQATHFGKALVEASTGLSIATELPSGLIVPGSTGG